MNDNLLDITDLTVKFGLATALDRLSIHIGSGEAVFIVGPNGAGKSTLLRAISGLEFPFGGKIEFLGKRIVGMTPWDVVGLGIVHVPQNRRCFEPLSVEENLLMGGYLQTKAMMTPKLDAVYTMFPVLAEKRRQKAGQLSGGQQQMLAIGRALMLDAHLIMLDEPSLGLAPMLVDALGTALIQIHRDLGAGVLLVEQNVNLALSVGTRGYILQSGRLVGEGAPEDLRGRLKEAYLGSEPAS